MTGSHSITAVLALGLAVGCRGAAPPEPRDPDASVEETASGGGTAAAPTRIEIVGVDLRLLPDASARVTRLEGTVSRVEGEGPVPLDDPSAYAIYAESASTFIGWQALSTLLNDYTFDFDGAPIGDLEASREEDEDERDRIEIKGNLKSALGLAFEIEGRPEVLPDGRIRIRTQSIEALNVPVGGLLHTLGLDAEDVVGNLEDRGVAFEGNDLVLDMSRALPPPRVNGKVTALRVEDDGIALTLGRAPGEAPGGTNHLWFHGGTIQIGRMTQTDADLLLVDQDPSDPFDFFGGRMDEQLRAGYAKMQADGGLTMHVPDFEDIESR